jgi:hypothetical protein
MRKALLMMLTMMVAGAPAWAQSATQRQAQQAPAVRECRPFDAPPLVVVTMRDGQKLRGTLTCLGDDAELVTGGRLSRTSLADVAKIAEPRDPLWEGPVVGAALGGLIWAICGSGCDSGYMLRATADYALLGLVIDAATSNNKTIYRNNFRSPALSLHIRF